MDHLLQRVSEQHPKTLSNWRKRGVVWARDAAHRRALRRLVARWAEDRFRSRFAGRARYLCYASQRYCGERHERSWRAQHPPLLVTRWEADRFRPWARGGRWPQLRHLCDERGRVSSVESVDVRRARKQRAPIFARWP